MFSPYQKLDEDEANRPRPTYMKFENVRNLPPLEDRVVHHGKIIHVFKDGDRDPRRPVKVLVNERATKSMEALMEEVGRKLKIHQAIRAIFTPENGSRILKFEHFQDDHVYIAGTSEKFIGIGENAKSPNQLEDIYVPHGKNIKVAMDGVTDAKSKNVVINPITMRTMNDILNEVGRVLQAQRVVRALFTPDHGTRIKSFDQLQEEGEYLAGTDRVFKGRNYVRKMRNQPLREDIELPQGKVIHVSLDGVKDSKPHKLLINPLVIKTFNGVLEELTRILRPPNAIRAIFTPEHGTRLTLYDQLQDDHIYIAGMTEKFRGQEYHQRLRDLPPIEMEDLPQGRIVYFYLDGDKYARPIRYLINHRTPKEFVEFLDEVGKKLKSPAPLRAVFTPESGTRVTMFQQLLDDHVYIAGSTDKMKGYKDIQSTQRVRSKPRNHDVEPVRHNKEYKDQEGRVAQSYQKWRVKRVTVYPFDRSIKHHTVTINPNCNSMEEVYDAIQKYFSPASGFRVEGLLDWDSYDEILDVQDIVDKGSYIVCPHDKIHKAQEQRERYGIRLKNFDTSSPRGPVGSNKYLWDTSDIKRQRPRTLPPLTKKGYKGSPNTSSVASNPEYKSRNRSQQNGGVHGRPVKHKRTPERRTNDYDRDDGGVFKPKNKSRDTHGAKEVEETHHTKTDLPIDQVQAEEVKDYDDFSVDHDTNLPSDVSLSRKPSDTPYQQIDHDDDDYHDDEEEDEKINSQQKNNNAKETTQKANSKQPERRQADQAHAKKDTGRKDSPPPVQKKHSGTRGEFNNVSPLPGIQSNDKRASTPREQKTSSPNAWSDDGRKNAADIKKNAEQIEKENKAATKIQAGVKGHQARKKLAEKKAEIKKEDANIKEDNAKRQKEQDAKSQKQKEDEAATKIQAGFRGHQTRKGIKKQKGEKEVNNAMGYSSGRSRDTLGNDEEEAAATKIQANYRGHKVRKEMNEKKSKKKEEDEEEAAATKIQAGFRGHKARKEVQQRKEEEKAATKIQAGFRGHQVRKELKNNKEGEGNAQGNTSPDVQNQSKAIGDVNATQGNTQTDVPKG